MIHAKSDFQLEKSFGHARLKGESRTQQKFEEARGGKNQRKLPWLALPIGGQTRDSGLQ